MLRKDFRVDSDVDVLVEFEPEHTPGFIRLAGIERELSELLGSRKVDIRTPEDLSRYFREEVIATAEELCMNKSDIVRLRHMNDAAHEALTFAAGKARQEKIWIETGCWYCLKKAKKRFA